MAVEASVKSGVLTPWPLQTRGRAGSALGGPGSPVGPEACYSASGTQALLSPALPTDVSSSFRASRSGSVSTQVDVVGSDGADFGQQVDMGLRACALLARVLHAMGWCEGSWAGGGGSVGTIGEPRVFGL